MTDCVLASLQAHIRHVVSLDELLDSISEEQINQEEIAKFKAQIADNEVKLEEARQFKATLYENFIANLISKKDYQDLKNLYTGRAEQAQEAIDRLRAEMDLVTNNSSSRLRWTQHFKEFSAMTTLDRRAVIAMVQSIRVEGKNDLVITLQDLKARAETDPAAAAELAQQRAQQSEAVKKSRQKMYADAAAGDPEAQARYERHLAARRENYHRKKQETVAEKDGAK